ncbi:MAG TPA: NDP-sugar synthase [Patescibacteria group bacterium]
MQVVLLAAGNSSRFVPFNKGLAHKSLITIMGKTLLEHTLLSVKQAGITDVILVVNKEEAFKKHIGNGEALGIKITYVVLEEALGMGAALLKAEQYLQDSFFLMSAYHLEFNEFAKDMLSMQKKGNVVLLGKKDAHFTIYGFMQLSGEKVTSVVEKPETEIPHAVRIIGIYLLNKQFVQFLKTVPQEHYNFEKALDEFAKQQDVLAFETTKTTITLKYGWDLLTIKNYLLSHLTSYTSDKAQIAKSAKITGNVYIEDGAKIMEDVTIKGPAYIGKNAFVGNNSVLRNGVILEEDAVAGSYLELKNVFMMQNATTHTGVIEDSVIGKNCKIAAGIITANVRLDRKEILATVKGEKINSGLTAFGIILGDNSQLGIRVSTMPGIVIGNNVLVGPNTTVMKNVEDNTKYFTKFQAVVEEKA